MMDRAIAVLQRLNRLDAAALDRAPVVLQELPSCGGCKQLSVRFAAELIGGHTERSYRRLVRKQIPSSLVLDPRQPGQMLHKALEARFALLQGGFRAVLIVDVQRRTQPLAQLPFVIAYGHGTQQEPPIVLIRLSTQAAPALIE
jgi:hypothetical protein